MAIQGVLTRQKCAETPYATFWDPTLDDLVPQKVIFFLGQLFPYFRVFRDFSKTDPCLVTSHIQSFSGPCPSEPHQKVSATEPIFIFSFHISSKWRYRTLFKTYFFVDFWWPPKSPRRVSGGLRRVYILKNDPHFFLFFKKWVNPIFSWIFIIP